MGDTLCPTLCRTAKRLGYECLALTDTDNLYGLWPFLRACKREGLTPIVGAEVTDPPRKQRAVCLVEDDGGYHNLCRLLSRRHRAAEFKLEAALAEYATGLTVLTQDADLLQHLYSAGVSGGCGHGAQTPACGPLLRRTPQALGVSAGGYAGKFFSAPRKISASIACCGPSTGNTSLSRLAPTISRRPMPGWHHRKNMDVGLRFVRDAVRATRRIAERLSFSGPQFGTVMPPLARCKSAEPTRRLRKPLMPGARRRYGAELSESVVERLEHELRSITARGFAAYFLIVRDIVRRSPRTCGRGSGAASLVAYCLGITNVCPLKHNLYFERFLNPGRKDPPDIDVDFAWDERDGVLEGVLSQYRGHAAMVANHVLFQPRMAIRETAKVFGLTDGEIGRVSRRLPHFWRERRIRARAFERAEKTAPKSRRLNFPAPGPRLWIWPGASSALPAICLYTRAEW